MNWDVANIKHRLSMNYSTITAPLNNPSPANVR